ncbi:unnamed protein product, partial [Rotaria sp. Silwood1]
DNVHCCPSGYTCDVEHSRCEKGFGNSDDVLCPDGEMLCSDGETCCQLQRGSYACCPLPDAVCCSDYSHCCPHGYKCNIELNRCEKGIYIQWFRKTSSFPLKNLLLSKSISYSSLKLIVNYSLSDVSTVKCSNKKSICPEEINCYQIDKQFYEYCLYRQAFCCSNKIDCCQNGYSCDKSDLICIKNFNLTKKKEMKNESLNKCGSSNKYCPFDQTCCKISQSNSNSYACCTFSHGVCCDDGRHCCPNGTICHYNKCWIVVCISDTHQKHRQLTERLKSSYCGDILIHAGDITNFARGSKPFDDFDQWLSELPFKHKLIIGGNHDSILTPYLNNGKFLENEQIIIDNYLHIYGSSWRPTGESTWLDIPSNSNIVITHNPPCSPNGSHIDLEGNLELRLHKIKPLISIFGHIHQDYGVWKDDNGILFANAASFPSSRSQTLNHPLRFKISIDENSLLSIEHII